MPREIRRAEGLFLLTDYPAQTVRRGETTTLRVKVNNAGRSSSRWRSRCRAYRSGWKADILGGGQPVAAVMAGVNQDVTVQLRIEVPKDAKPGLAEPRAERQGAEPAAGQPAA